MQLKSAPWLTALVTYKGLPLALRVRPAADTVANRAAFPTLTIVTHELAQVKSNGLPADTYNHSLMQFDLDLQAAIEGSDEGLVVLVETFSGNRNYYAYVANEDRMQARIDEIRGKYSEHTLVVTDRADPEWKFYGNYRKEFPW